MLLMQVGVLVVVVAGGYLLMSSALHDDLVAQYEQRALAVARSVAADPIYADRVEAGDQSGIVQERAEAVRVRTGALFVVVTDDQGIRYSHPNPDNIGEMVSTDPSVALAGGEVVAFERGTLGLSARGKVPLRNASGRVVGEVSAGIDAESIRDQEGALRLRTASFLGLALLVGSAGAFALARRLKRQTFGLEPRELADLLRESEAVVHGVQDGVLGVDRSGRITVCNDAADVLLGQHLAAGTPIADANLSPRLRDVIESRQHVQGMLTVAGDRALVVTSQPVERGGHDLGVVLTLRDRTQHDEMVRELHSVRALSDGLRAQAHEYTNRLHTVAGLLHLDHVEEARQYLGQLASDVAATGDVPAAVVADPYLRGLMAAKSASASEQGVHLRLSAGSELRTRMTSPLDVVTVVGNLLDNAIAAACGGLRRPAWVELSLVADGDDLLVAVIDSGDGIPEDIGDRVFQEGATTRTDEQGRHGIGLALARQVARSHSGDLELLHRRGDDHGAVFSARLAGVVARTRPASAEPV
jgi:two-component system CitB family sensor kinase